jgi:DNA polymerase-3 subunit delta
MAKSRYPKDLQADITAGRIAPVYVFVGGGPEETGKFLDSLRRAVVQPGFEAFDGALLDGVECSGADVVIAARMGAMGGKGRLIVLDNPQAFDPPGRQALVEFIRNPAEGNCLVVRVDEQEWSGLFARAGTETGATISFRTPSWVRKGDLIREALRKHGLRAEGGALAILEAMLPADAGGMNRELEKIRLSLGGSARVTADDLTDLLMGRRGGEFELGDRLLDRDLPGAARVLDNLLQQGEEPLSLLGQMARQYRMILAQKRRGETGSDADAAKETKGLPPAVRERIGQAADRYGEGELLDNLRRVKRADRLLKSTPLSATLILQSIVTGLLRPEEIDAA